MYANGWGVTKDDKEAFRWFRKAAELGYAAAQTRVGIDYWEGKGTTQNYDESIPWFRKAASQGDPYGREWLGDAYRMAHGVEGDMTKAAQLYCAAAEGGGGPSVMNKCGYSLLIGAPGIAQDYVGAIKWLLLAVQRSGSGEWFEHATVNLHRALEGATDRQIEEARRQVTEFRSKAR
jgi:TPR repeat protein